MDFVKVKHKKFETSPLSQNRDPQTVQPISWINVSQLLHVDCYGNELEIVYAGGHTENITCESRTTAEGYADQMIEAATRGGMA